MTDQTVQRHKLNIGLSDDQRVAVIRLLNRVLADQHVLYVKTRNYHWNVIGPEFYAIHKLLEEQYEQLEDAMDEVAERVRQMGGHAVGTMAEYLQLATLKEEAAGTFPSAREMLTKLRDDHEATARQLRADVDEADDQEDEVTADFLSQLALDHEKMAWMLGAMVAPDHSMYAGE